MMVHPWALLRDDGPAMNSTVEGNFCKVLFGCLLSSTRHLTSGHSDEVSRVLIWFHCYVVDGSRWQALRELSGLLLDLPRLSCSELIFLRGLRHPCNKILNS
jgi:hypothetical protein